MSQPYEGVSGSRMGNAPGQTSTVKPVIVRPVDTGQPSPGFRDRISGGVSRINTMQSAADRANVSLPDWLPRGTGFLAHRTTILWMWVTSMAIISADEWKSNHIFPRPGRLWAATRFFALLAALSMIDMMVPLANALAVGYTIMLLWDFFGSNANTT